MKRLLLVVLLMSCASGSREEQDARRAREVLDVPDSLFDREARAVDGALS